MICDTVKMKRRKIRVRGDAVCWDLPWLRSGTGGKESVQMRLALENSKIEMKGIGKM